MIDKASSKRFEGWPLDSLSINKENGKYFVDGSIAFCRVQRTPMRFRADAVQSTTDALKQCIFSYSRGFITTV